MEPFKVIAPTRADLAGGTLDLWPLFCLVDNAKTVNIALDLPAIAKFSVEKHECFKVELKTHTGEAYFFEKVPEWEDIRKLGRGLQFPVAVISRYLAEKKELPSRLISIEIETKVPIGSGLGGSSALCVALARGMARLFGDYVDQGWQWKMMEWVRDLEAAFLKIPTGTQDYLASLFGGLNCFSSSLGGIERVGYPEGVFEALSQRLLILYSGEVHQSGLSNWQIFKDAFEGDARTLKGLSEINRVATELDGELRAGSLNWKFIGKCMSEEWEVRRELFQVNTPRLEEIMTFVKDMDVLGCKVCGAAQGGSLVVLATPESRSRIVQECSRTGIQVLSAQGTRHGASILPITAEKK